MRKSDAMRSIHVWFSCNAGTSKETHRPTTSLLNNYEISNLIFPFHIINYIHLNTLFKRLKKKWNCQLILSPFFLFHIATYFIYSRQRRRRIPPPKNISLSLLQSIIHSSQAEKKNHFGFLFQTFKGFGWSEESNVAVEPDSRLALCDLNRLSLFPKKYQMRSSRLLLLNFLFFFFSPILTGSIRFQ